MPNNTEEFIPENLKLWTIPESWYGKHWEGYYVFLGKHRDSDILTVCNYDVAYSRIESLNTEFDGKNTIVKVSESHWAVGWIEWIAIHESNIPALKLADSIQSEINEYPILDEEKHTQMEEKEANRIWKECYRVKDRIKYIRENESEFDFSSYSDLIRNVRGEYFSGYASELIG